MGSTIRIKAFTVVYNGRSNILRSKVTIGVAFDPRSTPPPGQVEFDAIWDTGASASVITQTVISKCGLKPIGMTHVNTAAGVRTCNTYLVSLMLPNDVGFPSVRVTEGIISGTDVLIGMDIIGAGDFSVSNFEGKTVFSYRFPSVAKTDYVAEVNHLNKTQMTKVGRNSPCPCGSGKKYKKCHGKN